MYIPRRALIVISCVLALGMASCASAPDQKPGAAIGMSQQEQDTAALVLFQKVFDALGTKSRAEALPEMESTYREIIDRYPAAVLAQEAYWRIIVIYLNDYTPPAFDKAEAMYDRFIARHEASQFRGEIDNALTDGYTRHGQWERLLRMYTPAVRQYIQTGTLAKPRDMFIYAEAKFRLNDLVEAEKGYKIVIALFPKTRESAVASERLEEIKARKAK